jgi:hypothetical protein
VLLFFSHLSLLLLLAELVGEKHSISTIDNPEHPEGYSISNPAYPQMFPPIPASPGRSSDVEFRVSLEGIEDLFYDGLTDPASELIKIQRVLDKNKAKMTELYMRNGKSMDRRSFEDLVQSLTGLDSAPANEIFDCATNLYDHTDEDEVIEPAADAWMTAEEFSVAIVRLANLWALMNEGMVDTSRLADQTNTFLDSLERR